MEITEQMVEAAAKAFQDAFTNGNATWDDTPQHHKDAFMAGARSALSAAPASASVAVKEARDFSWLSELTKDELEVVVSSLTSQEMSVLRKFLFPWPHQVDVEDAFFAGWKCRDVHEVMSEERVSEAFNAWAALTTQPDTQPTP